MVPTGTRPMEPTLEPVTPTLIIRTTRTRDTMMIAPTPMIEDILTSKLTHRELTATMMSRKRADFLYTLHN